jgi:hypothetical protein
MDTSQRLKDLAVSESGFVFDPHSGQTFSLNQPGRIILEALKHGASVAEIVVALGAAFQVEPGADLPRDVREFLLVAKEQGWPIPQVETP